jgi:cytochrome c553
MQSTERVATRVTQRSKWVIGGPPITHSRLSPNHQDLLHPPSTFRCFFTVRSVTGHALGRADMAFIKVRRWLLMTHDRIAQDEFPLTHEFLDIMLGVRRPTVTNLQAVQKALAANDMAAAETARANVAPQCMACHTAHREKTPEGGWRMK